MHHTYVTYYSLSTKTHHHAVAATLQRDYQLIGNVLQEDTIKKWRQSTEEDLSSLNPLRTSRQREKSGNELWVWEHLHTERRCSTFKKTNQFAGCRRSLIFCKSSIQSRCGNMVLACCKKYGNKSSTWPWQITKLLLHKSQTHYSSNIN